MLNSLFNEKQYFWQNVSVYLENQFTIKDENQDKHNNLLF